MQYLNTILLSLLAGTSMVSAAPVDADTNGSSNIYARDAVNVGYGQQIQESNEANYWVVWVEGKSACPNLQSLGPLTDSPCDLRFQLPGGGEKLYLGDCDGNNEPHSLYFDGGSFIRTCSSDHDKINCHGSEHDIVKHGKCKA